jgi:hypothetical protein
MLAKNYSPCVALAAVLLIACNGRDSSGAANPVAPTSNPGPATSSVTVSGVVAEGGRPIAGARVGIAALAVEPGRGSAAWPAGQTTTDAAGRYRVAVTDFMDSLSKQPTVWVLASADGYVQQCPASATLNGDATINVRLTSIAALSFARPAAAANLRTVSGAVFEATPTGRGPVHGAMVAWEAGFDGGVAWTLTDAAGFYFLCDLPRGEIYGLFASKEGIVGTAPRVPAGDSAVVDIELRAR